MFNRFYSFAVALATMLTVNVSAQTETKYAPTLDVNFRTASGNTAWNSGYPKSAANEGNKDFELTYTAGLFALQKYTVPDIQNATKLVLTLTVGSKSGVDAVRLWSIPLTAWDASTGVDDIVPAVTTATGVAPRATEGTANSPLVTGAKVAESDPAKATWTITGTALATIKANAAADGTFTLLLTNNDLLNSNNKRSYLSSSSANDEANRPTLVATTTAPTPKTAKIGDKGYANLAAALAVVKDGETITLLADQEVSSRINVKDMSVTIDGGGFAIKRATTYTNGLMFLTQAKTAGTGKDAELTLKNITIDGQNVSTSAAVIEAGNKGTTTLNGVTIQNVVTSANASIVNKSGGKLVLKGNIAVPSIFVGKSGAKSGLKVDAREATITSPIALTMDNGYPYVMIVEGGKTTDFTATTYRLSQQPDGIYAMPQTETYEYAHPALLHSAVEIETAKGRLTTEPYASAYTALEAASAGTAAGSVEFLKRMDKNYRLSQQPDGIYAMPQTETYEYAHPALLHSAVEIETAKGRLTTEPYASAYTALEAASAGTAAGSVEFLKRMDKNNWEAIYPDYNNFSRATKDAKLAYELALRYQLKGATAAAASAVNILNDWATNCKGILRISGKNYVNNIPDPNEYLILIQAYQFANAAELLKGYSGWTADAQSKFNTWMKETFADFAVIFLENHHGNANPLHYWLNWDLAALNALVSVGVLTNDKALVDYALNYVDNGTGTGNKNNAIVAVHQDADSDEVLAQCQESGRDQGHSTLDVTLMGALCQMTQNSGANTDLWTAYKALEMAEYVGKYNLKNATSGAFVYDNVPFTKYTNNEQTHTVLSADGRGNERFCWELFHAYAKANNKADAYTAAWVKYFREKNPYGEGASSTSDELGFGTLMFGAEAIPTAISTAKTGAAQVNVTEYFDLSGRRVAQPTKGLYIVNGKKVIVK